MSSGRKERSELRCVMDFQISRSKSFGLFEQCLYLMFKFIQGNIWINVPFKVGLND
jgi:hypothetical protein